MTILKSKEFFLYVLLVYLPFSVWAQTNFEELERQRNKANKIKSREQWDYRYKGEKLSEKGDKSSLIKYDKNGNIIEEINYKTSINPKGKEELNVLNVYTYKYDSKDNKTEYIKYKGDREKLEYKQLITYDSKGNKLYESGFNGINNYKNTYKYNAEGKLIQIVYYLDNNIDEKRIFTYQGDETSITIFTGSKIMKSTIWQKHDKTGKLLEKVTKDKNRVILEKLVYKYDTKGNLVEEKKYIGGRLDEELQYKYDDQGVVHEVMKAEEDVPLFTAKLYTYDNQGGLKEEKWRKRPEDNYSSKTYTYNNKGICTEIIAFFARYKYKVLYKFNYDYY